MLTAIEIWELVKAHWQKLGWAAPVLLVTTVKGCAATADLQAKLSACEAKPPQVVTVSAKAKQDVHIVYRDGSPCPDVTATNESEATAVLAEAKTTPCPVPPDLALWLSAGYVGEPLAGLGVEYKWAGVEVNKTLTGWGGQARVRLLAF